MTLTLTPAVPAQRPAPPEPGDLAREVAAEALFASPLQPSDHPSREEAVAAVRETLARYGDHAKRACAEKVAQASGKHPDEARARMRWALSVVSS